MKDLKKTLRSDPFKIKIKSKKSVQSSVEQRDLIPALKV
jgi:hypothetical protein